MCCRADSQHAARVLCAAELTRYTQPVFVERENPNSRHDTIEAIKQRARSRGRWPQVIIFPEGTVTNRSCLITFKQGTVCRALRSSNLVSVLLHFKQDSVLSCFTSSKVVSVLLHVKQGSVCLASSRYFLPFHVPCFHAPTDSVSKGYVCL